jgi:hypothetical protein
MKQTRQAVHTVNQSIFLDVNGGNSEKVNELDTKKHAEKKGTRF